MKNKEIEELKKLISKNTELVFDIEKALNNYNNAPTSVVELLNDKKQSLISTNNNLGSRINYLQEIEDIENNETEENLVMYCANALKTYYGAGGHTKAQMNESRAEYWKSVLHKRGFRVPSNSELSEKGVFNGKGSV